MRISILRIVLVIGASIPLVISVNPDFLCSQIYNGIQISFSTDPGWNCSTDNYINKSISRVTDYNGIVQGSQPDEYFPTQYRVVVRIWKYNLISATATISNYCFSEIDLPDDINCTIPMPYVKSQTEKGTIFDPDVPNEIFVEIGNYIVLQLFIWTQRQGPVHDIPDNTETYPIEMYGMPQGIYEYSVQMWFNTTDTPLFLAWTDIIFTYGGCYTSFTQNGNIVTVTLTRAVYTLYIYIQYIYRPLIQGTAAARPW